MRNCNPPHHSFDTVSVNADSGCWVTADEQPVWETRSRLQGRQTDFWTFQLLETGWPSTIIWTDCVCLNEVPSTENSWPPPLVLFIVSFLLYKNFYLYWDGDMGFGMSPPSCQVATTWINHFPSHQKHLSHELGFCGTRQRNLGFGYSAITKYHRLSALNNRNLFSHSSRGWASIVKVPSGLVSREFFIPDFLIVFSHGLYSVYLWGAI